MTAEDDEEAHATIIPNAYDKQLVSPKKIQPYTAATIKDAVDGDPFTQGLLVRTLLWFRLP